MMTNASGPLGPAWPFNAADPFVDQALRPSAPQQGYLPPSVHFGMPSGSAYSQYGPFYHPSGSQWSSGVDDNSWNRVFKLVLLSFVSTIGSMGSIFIVSAITVIDTFQVRGNAHLVSMAFGHLLVTILVLPASAIAIMANVTEDPTLCHFQWLVTLACMIVCVLSFFFMSLDHYFNLRSMVTYRLCCTKCRILFAILLVWTAAFLFPFFQHTNSFGPEFCKDRRQWKVMLDYHPYLLGALVVVTIITIAYFTHSLFMYKSYKLQLENSSSTNTEIANYILADGYLLQSNVFVYLISLVMWLPLIVVMVIDPINPVPQHYLDTVWYVALANSCCYSYLYAAMNRDFREAFNKLFYYCCCKSHVTFTRKGAAMRRTVANESMGLRVHIIPGLNIYAARKDPSGYATSSYRPGSSGMTSGGGGYGHSGGGFYKSNKSCEL